MLRPRCGQSQSMMILRRLILFAVLSLLATSVVRSEPVYRVGYANAIATGCDDNAKGCTTLTTDSTSTPAQDEPRVDQQNAADDTAVDEGKL